MPKAKRAKTAEIEKLLKDGDLMLGTDPSLVVQRISSGIPDLDAILNGGFPRKRITIVAGEFSTGKSLLVQLAFKEAIKNDLQVAYIDAEQSYDPEWWNQLGLPMDKVLVSQPATGEKAVDLAVGLASAGVDIIAIDSLAALVPMEEAEAAAEKKFIALQARLINKLMKQLLTTKHNSVILCTNQLREQIGYGPVDPMPGGRGQNFFTSLLLRTKREGWIEENKKRVGFNIRIVCRKNKVGKPFGECVLPFMFRGEIDMLSLLLDRAIEAGVITMKGPWFGGKVGTVEFKELGRNSMIDWLREHPKTMENLETVVGKKQDK